MTSAPPEPKLPHKNPGVEKPEGFFVKNSCIVRKSDNPHFGALLEHRRLTVKQENGKQCGALKDSSSDL